MKFRGGLGRGRRRRRKKKKGRNDDDAKNKTRREGYNNGSRRETQEECQGSNVIILLIGIVSSFTAISVLDTTTTSTAAVRRSINACAFTNSALLWRALRSRSRALLRTARIRSTQRWLSRGRRRRPPLTSCLGWLCTVRSDIRRRLRGRELRRAHVQLG